MSPAPGGLAQSVQTRLLNHAKAIGAEGPIQRIEVEGVGVRIPKALELLVISRDAAGVLWGAGRLA